MNPLNMTIYISKFGCVDIFFARNMIQNIISGKLLIDFNELEPFGPCTIVGVSSSCPEVIVKEELLCLVHLPDCAGLPLSLLRAFKFLMALDTIECMYLDFINCLTFYIR